jgi:hypothetical protein
MRLRRLRAEAEITKIQAETHRIRMDTSRVEAEIHRAGIMHDIAIERLRLEMLRIKRDTKPRDDIEEGA